ncbi:hypothetical protein [Leptospira brenneri]|uniref:hypothetical protein n=1 Tax=Leptospira brenneri TaxID=2023182 RepID=UPI000C2A77B9|nr:hypothetical protein [Leptospira brenneri]PJZ43783.1 hypothetical protein CH361_18700 [Leptospira brenneri]
MITPSDFAYNETKDLLKGKKKIQEPFDELLTWISAKYDVKTINVFYDFVIPDHRPRLQVILEKRNDYLFFKEKGSFNFKKEIQEEISEKFIEIINRDNYNNFEINSLFTVFSDFESIAIAEANTKITEREIETLLSEINDKELWKIERCFATTVLFYYTLKQKEKSLLELKNKLYTLKYFDLIKKYDEFGFLNKDTFSILFDCKENFDKNFNGNWFNYWR